jgi:hypothetical protein
LEEEESLMWSRMDQMKRRDIWKKIEFMKGREEFAGRRENLYWRKKGF